MGVCFESLSIAKSTLLKKPGIAVLNLRQRRQVSAQHKTKEKVLRAFHELKRNSRATSQAMCTDLA
jgi:hypothetical protein